MKNGKRSNIYIVYWACILIIFFINLFKQICIPEITKDVTLLLIMLIIYILINEFEIKHLRETREMQNDIIDEAMEGIGEAKEIIIELSERNKKLEEKLRKEKKYEL